MTEEGGIFVAVVAVAVAFALLLLFKARIRSARNERGRLEANQRMEALFRASFPELQPHFHPARVHEYVRLRRGLKAPTGPTTWRKPAGFPAAEAAEITPDGSKDRVRLVDAAGGTIASFVYEEHPEGGVIRYGKGKFTVNVKGPEPRVRYWHPEREFKWTPSSWKLGTRLADQSLESRDSSPSFSDSSSASSSSSSSFSRGAATAAAAGGIVAAGGAFDGGGASGAWDEAGGASGGDGGGSAGAADDGGGGDGASGDSAIDSSSSTSTSY